MKRHFYSVKRWLSIVSCAALTAGLASVASFPAAQAEVDNWDVNLSLGDWNQITENFDSHYSPRIKPGMIGYETAAERNAADLWEIKTDSQGSRLIRKETDSGDSAGTEGAWGENDKMAVLTYKGQQFENFELEVDYKQGINSWKWAMVGFGALHPGKFAAEEDGGFAAYTELEGRPILWSAGFTEYYANKFAGDPLLAKWYSDQSAAIRNRAVHHMKLTVANKKLTMDIDGHKAVLTYNLPDDYSGGYIYLAAGCNQAEFSNLRIRELNKDDLPDPDALVYKADGYCFEAEEYAQPVDSSMSFESFQCYRASGGKGIKLIAEGPAAVITLPDSIPAGKYFIQLCYHSWWWFTMDLTVNDDTTIRQKCLSERSETADFYPMYATANELGNTKAKAFTLKGGDKIKLKKTSKQDNIVDREVLLDYVRLIPATDTLNKTAANESSMRFLGRTFEENGVRYFNWNNAGFQVTFTGTALRAYLCTKTNVENEFWWPRVDVYVDGEAAPKTSTVQLTAREGWYTLVEGLTDGVHTVTVRKPKRLYISDGTPEYVGVQSIATDGTLGPVPPEKKLKLEAIGDSITNGEFVHFWNETFASDSWQSYAAHAARILDADLNSMAISGAGLVCAWDGSDSLELPDQFSYADGEQSKISWDFSQYQSDVVIINLGTNDYGSMLNYPSTTICTKDKFQQKYVEFIETIKDKYPDCKVIAMTGSIDSNAKTEIQNAVAAANQQAEEDYAYFLEVPSSKTLHAEGGDGFHPGVEAQKIHGEMLAELIREILPEESEPDPTESTQSSDPTPSSSQNHSTEGTQPDTGEHVSLWPMLAVAVAGAAIMALLLLYRRRFDA